MEHRMSRVEEQVYNLAQEQAALTSEMRQLTANIKDLKPDVEALTAALNKLKGIIWFAGVIGAVVGWSASVLFGRHT